MSVEQMLDHVKSWRFTQAGQCEWSGRFLRCEQEPRISVLVRYNAKQQKSTQVWIVDGVAHISFESAMAKLVLDCGIGGEQQ